ncbi:MAG: hypothetical protein ACPH05_08235, partial [Luminiphilus sp.]
MKRIDLWKLLLVLSLTFTLSTPVFAEDAPAAPEAKEAAPAAEEASESTEDGEAKEEEKPKTIGELTEDADRFDGLFTLFRDPKTGATKMLIAGDQINKEFIYFKHTMNGVVDAGAFTGSYGDQFIFTIERRFDKVEFVRQNTAYYFDPSNAIARASDKNISRAVLAV